LLGNYKLDLKLVTDIYRKKGRTTREITKVYNAGGFISIEYKKGKRTQTTYLSMNLEMGRRSTEVFCQKGSF